MFQVTKRLRDSFKFVMGTEIKVAGVGADHHAMFLCSYVASQYVFFLVRRFGKMFGALWIGANKAFEGTDT